MMTQIAFTPSYSVYNSYSSNPTFGERQITKTTRAGKRNSSTTKKKSSGPSFASRITIQSLLNFGSTFVGVTVLGIGGTAAYELVTKTPTNSFLSSSITMGTAGVLGLLGGYLGMDPKKKK